MQHHVEITWFNNQIDDLVSDVRKAEFGVRQFEDDRQALRSTWSDSCSNELSIQFFDPHIEAADKSILTLKQAETPARDMSSSIEAGYDQFDIALDSNRQFEMGQVHCERMASAIDSHVRVANEHRSASLLSIEESERLMDAAQMAAG